VFITWTATRRKRKKENIRFLEIISVIFFSPESTHVLHALCVHVYPRVSVLSTTKVHEKIAVDSDKEMGSFEITVNGYLQIEFKCKF
jgi:hypothetical protein